MRKEKGITLVALVITIIVLIILAAVSIKAVMNGGVIVNAKTGKEKWDTAKTNEEEKLESLLEEIEGKHVQSESEQLTIKETTGEKLKNYRIYGNSVQQLPSDYQEVEYIENTGTEYIDTGFVDSENTKVILDFIYTKKTSDDEPNYIGARGGNLLYINNSNDKFGIGGKESNLAAVPNTRYQVILKRDANNNRTGKINEYAEFSGSSASMKNNFCIFAYGGSIDSATICCKLYTCKIYKNDELVRDYIPCYRKSDNVVGLYDLVENKFYTNVGTGTFTKGNDVLTTDEANKVKSVGELITDTTDDNYGKYKIPVKVSGKNLLDISKIANIYLNEPLRKLDDKADYIDFKNQKVVRYIKEENGVLSLIENGPTEEKISLPEIPTINGTTIITIETTVAPSKIEVNYETK